MKECWDMQCVDKTHYHAWSSSLPPEYVLIDHADAHIHVCACGKRFNDSDATGVMDRGIASGERFTFSELAH